MTIVKKASIATTSIIVIAGAMVLGAVLRPSTKAAGAEVLCRPGDSSAVTSAATSSVASETTDQSTTSTATSTTSNTTNNSHSNNDGIATGNDVLSHIKVGDVNVLNNASVLNNADVDVLNNTTATVSNVLNGTVKTVVDIL